MGEEMALAMAFKDCREGETWPVSIFERLLTDTPLACASSEMVMPRKRRRSRI